MILLIRFSCLFACTWAHIVGISPSPLRDKYILTCSFLAQVPYESLFSALSGRGIHPAHTPSPPPSTHPQMARIAVANLNLGANKAQVSFGGWRSWCTSGDGTPLIIQAFRLKSNVKKDVNKSVTLHILILQNQVNHYYDYTQYHYLREFW